MAGNLFFVFGIFFTLYCHFNFLTSLFVSSGYIPGSLNIVLLVVLEHPLSIFLAAVICIVFCCFRTDFAFPSYTSPAYFNFGTITLIRLHLPILVSRCRSVRIASILSAYVSSFPIAFAMCAYLVQGTFTGLRSVVHPLLTSIWNLPDSQYLRYIQLLRTFSCSLPLSIS